MSIPEFTMRLTDKEATPGGEVRLECKAQGAPMPEVKWYKNDEPIQAAIDKYNITSSVEGIHTLVIAGVHLSDNQCYKCEAANEYGCVSTHAHVVVHENTGINADFTLPAFVDPLHSISVNAGEDAVLTCTAKGMPTPEFSWEKGETAITGDDRIHITVSNGTTTLKIKAARDDDAGMYYCLAINKIGKVKSSTTLKVLGADLKSNAPKEAPASSKQPEKQPDSVDTTGVAEGEATEPNVNNEDKEHQLERSSVLDSVEHDTSENIERSKMSLEEYSKYVTDSSAPACVPTTELLSDIKKYYRNLPKFIVLPRSKWVELNSSLEINIEVKRFPDLSIAWYKDDAIVDDERCSIICETPDKKEQVSEEPTKSDNQLTEQQADIQDAVVQLPEDSQESKDTIEHNTEIPDEMRITNGQSTENKTEDATAEVKDINAEEPTAVSEDINKQPIVEDAIPSTDITNTNAEPTKDTISDEKTGEIKESKVEITTPK